MYMYTVLPLVEIFVKYKMCSHLSSSFCRFLPYIYILQEFWNPTSPIQNTIILLIEKIVVAMGDELKVYIPPMVQPMLRLFLQDSSEQNMTTQKV